jgi:YggT family protein
MFITFLYNAIQLLFQILTFAIIARALLSWFPIRPGNPFYPLLVILHQITEPILAPLRRLIPMIGMFDISPIVALVLLQLGQSFLLEALLRATRGF